MDDSADIPNLVSQAPPVQIEPALFEHFSTIACYHVNLIFKSFDSLKITLSEFARYFALNSVP